MKIIPKFILTCLLLATAVVVISAEQTPRRLTATEYSNIFSGTFIPEGEDKETPFVPWAVLVRFPWTESGSIISNNNNNNNDSATLAFNDASSKFPASIVRFGELVLDTPDALAIADLFGLTQLPIVQVLHGQQGRFEQMKNMGGLPFADVPFDNQKNVVQGHPVKTSSSTPQTTASGKKDAGNNNEQESERQKMLVESSSFDIVQFIAKALPVTVFSQLDHQEMPSIVKITTLHEAAEFLIAADQISGTIIAMQPLVTTGGKHKKSRQAATSTGNDNKKKSTSSNSIGREWIQVATVSTGAQFVGRNGGMVFLLDATTIQEDDTTSISELSLSQEMLQGTCIQDEELSSSSACFDIVSVSLLDAATKKAKTSLVKTSADISDIHIHVRHTTVVESVPRKPSTRSFNEISAAISGKWQEYSAYVLARHSAARERYARIFAPLIATSGDQQEQQQPIAQDLIRPLISTAQFQNELHQSRGGMFVIAFMRPSDRHYERHLKSVNELAASLFKDRRVQENTHEMRAEFFTVDTDTFPSVAEAFQAAQVPSMFVLHHLDNNRHGVAQFRGEFSIDKLKPMEKFVRDLCFDSKNLAQFRADKVVFEMKASKSKKHDNEIKEALENSELLRHSFHIPFMDLSKELSNIFVSPSSFTLVDMEASSSKTGKKSTTAGKKSATTSDKNNNKKKETPAQEAKRLKKEAAEKREKEERKRKIEEEIEQRRKGKEEKIKQKKAEEEEKKKKIDAENEAKLQKIKEEVRSGKRVKKITREDIRARREAALKKVKPKQFDYRRQERLEKSLKVERGYVGQVFTEGDFTAKAVLVKDVLY